MAWPLELGTLLVSTWIGSGLTTKYSPSLKKVSGTNALAYFFLAIRGKEKISLTSTPVCNLNFNPRINILKKYCRAIFLRQ
jgi:hypothetical protein